MSANFSITVEFAGSEGLSDNVQMIVIAEIGL